MNALIARLDVSEVDWVGTSLGGLIGMIMAGFPGSIVRRLVINDIGPFVSSTGLHRIGQYIGSMPSSFATIEDAEKYFRTVLAPYGQLADSTGVTSRSTAFVGRINGRDMLCCAIPRSKKASGCRGSSR
jgi:pimeloyl-ACP methyl ester carboxylesterase